jgi:hypothetical protein
MSNRFIITVVERTETMFGVDAGSLSEALDTFLKDESSIKVYDYAVTQRECTKVLSTGLDDEELSEDAISDAVEKTDGF